MTIVFAQGTEGYHTFRIPAIITSGPALLAFAEGRRHHGGDSGDIDLVLRRSFDGGRTWGPLQVVLRHGEDTAGNPCPVVDPASGDVVLLSTRNGGGVHEQDIKRNAVEPHETRRVYVQRSADHGETWSEAVEITSDVKPA
ncbi:MAG TPA: sialidase family protein, partial [Actinopolymorphaceae bacterium]